MTIQIYLSLLICIIGLIVYGWHTPAPTRWAEIGRLMFWTGLLAFLLQFGKIVNLLPRG